MGKINYSSQPGSDDFQLQQCFYNDRIHRWGWEPGTANSNPAEKTLKTIFKVIQEEASNQRSDRLIT